MQNNVVVLLGAVPGLLQQRVETLVVTGSRVQTLLDHAHQRHGLVGAILHDHVQVMDEPEENCGFISGTRIEIVVVGLDVLEFVRGNGRTLRHPAN